MMSDEEVTIETSEQVLAEYKDGQLQIVEVTPFEKGERAETHIVPDCENTGNQSKYIQVLDPSRGLVQLDLLNLTFVRCQDDQGYQLVTNAESSDGEAPSDTTVTCVLQSSDTEDHENQEYVMLKGHDGNEQLVLLQGSLNKAKTETKKQDEMTMALTPAEILEKAKILQRARQSHMQTTNRSGRKRKSDLPPAHELLTSPNFKLYLYSCKLCSFKCNAVKEMSAHKALEHGSGRSRGTGGRSSATLQCARCPFRGITHSQLMKHVREEHLEDSIITGTVNLDTQEVEAADVLVCGACGFESSSRPTFRRHIEKEHGAIAC